MRSLKTITVGVGILAVVAALIGLRDDKAIANLKMPGNNPGFAVVELFTSQGCSSCPPADALVEEIQKDNETGQIYILAFHVDYWNHQGWKDPFSNKEFTTRQRQYTRWLDVQGLYTPQIVVNGTTEHVGSDKRSVLSAISGALAQETMATLTMNAWIKDDQVHVIHSATSDDENYQLLLAIVQKEAQSHIRAGENAGRSLSHVQIVRKISQFSLADRKEAIIELPKDLDRKSWEIIGFVQQTHTGHIAAAARIDFD